MMQPVDNFFSLFEKDPTLFNKKTKETNAPKYKEKKTTYESTEETTMVTREDFRNYSGNKKKVEH